MGKCASKEKLPNDSIHVMLKVGSDRELQNFIENRYIEKYGRVYEFPDRRALEETTAFPKSVWFNEISQQIDDDDRSSGRSSYRSASSSKEAIEEYEFPNHLWAFERQSEHGGKSISSEPCIRNYKSGLDYVDMQKNEMDYVNLQKNEMPRKRIDRSQEKYGGPEKQISNSTMETTMLHLDDDDVRDNSVSSISTSSPMSSYSNSSPSELLLQSMIAREA